MSTSLKHETTSVIPLYTDAGYTTLIEHYNSNSWLSNKIVITEISLVFLLSPVLIPVMLYMFVLSLLSAGPVLRKKIIRMPGGIPYTINYFNTSHSLARLAQLWNLIKGEMNLIGPPADSENVRLRLAYEMTTKLVTVKPGIFLPNQSKKQLGLLPDETDEYNCEALRHTNLFAKTGIVLRIILAEIFSPCRNLNTKSVVDVFGIDIANISFDQALAWIRTAAKGEQTSFLAYVNAHCLNVAHADPEFRLLLKKADIVFPDGIGIKIAARLRGVRLLANLNGTDLFPHICKLAEQDKLCIYLLGGRSGVADTVASNMCKRYPDLNIAGTHDGYFSKDNEAKIIDDINSSGTDILLVAMGVPRQEKWLECNKDKLNAGLVMGVGGLFDFYSERISRAPLWVRELSMEWLWRLFQEPGRMWRRYVIGNPLFVTRLNHENRMLRARQKNICRSPLPVLGNIADYVRHYYYIVIDQGFAFLKRAVDVFCSGLGMLIFSPLLLILIIVIKLDSPGPIFFSQTRVGKHGKHFRIWKLRSMYVDAESRKLALQKQNEMHGGVTFKLARDPRITRVGRLIRKISIDELPQLWNVFSGDMSLVGPRPPLPSEVSEYNLDDRYRLDVIPGITCIWQVSGRSLLPFKKQVKLDLEYIRNMSLFQDISILLRTIPAVITGRGAC